MRRSRHGRDRPSADGRRSEAATNRTPSPETPSPQTMLRFAGAMTRELDQLRSGLSQELTLAFLNFDAGRVEEAVRIVDDSSDRLEHFRLRVEAALAAAAVEREAEGILASTSPSIQPASRDAEPDIQPTRTLVRALATAGCLLLAIASALLFGNGLPDQLVAGRSKQSTVTVADDERTSGNLAAPDIDGQASAAPDSRKATSARDRTTDDAETLAILRLLGRPGSLLARFAEDSRSAPVATLLGVDRLVKQLVAEANTLLPPFPSAPAPDLSSQQPQRKAGPQQQPQPPPARPQARPRDAPASKPPTSEQPLVGEPTPPQATPGEPTPAPTPSPSDVTGGLDSQANVPPDPR